MTAQEHSTAESLFQFNHNSKFKKDYKEIMGLRAKFNCYEKQKLLNINLLLHLEKILLSIDEWP